MYAYNRKKTFTKEEKIQILKEVEQEGVKATLQTRMRHKKSIGIKKASTNKCWGFNKVGDQPHFMVRAGGLLSHLASGETVFINAGHK